MISGNTYALILAGGSGRRFWPLSRDNRPKQMLTLFGEKTLLEQALSRLDGLVAPSNILILTNVEQEDQVREIIGDRLPPENIVAEPAKRDTGPAIALGVGWVAARNADATMLVVPADQLIQDREAFRQCMSAAIEVAERSRSLVTVGIRPTWACPSYGYIERGRRAVISGFDSERAAVYEVEKFREKPDAELAEQFLARGNFSWNAGIFIWTIPAVLMQLSLHCPELAKFAGEVRQSRDFEATIRGQFAKLHQISIDYALMEKAERVLNVEATFDWDDLGSWISAGKYFPKDPAGNASKFPITQLESEGNIVFSDGECHVALLGVEDLIVVQTKDALLIAHKHAADAIKKLVDLVPPELH